MGRKWARTCINCRKLTRSSEPSVKNAWTIRSHSGLMANSGMRRKSSRLSVPQSVRSSDVNREYNLSIWFEVTAKQQHETSKFISDFQFRFNFNAELKNPKNYSCSANKPNTYSQFRLEFDQFPLDEATETIYFPFLFFSVKISQVFRAQRIFSQPQFFNYDTLQKCYVAECHSQLFAMNFGPLVMTACGMRCVCVARRIS